MASKITKLIFIGDDFYNASRTMMSPIYAETGERYDWGFVNRDLQAGKKVHIRPATADELRKYQGKLIFGKLME